MLKIRLQRTGRKHDPTYRVVLTDSKNGPKSGKFIEILGHYDARRNDDTVINSERIQYWIGQGAQTSDTVHNLLIKEEVIAGEKKNVLPKKSPIIDEEKLKAEQEAKEAEEKAKADAEAAAKEEAKEVVEEKEETKEEEAQEEKTEEPTEVKEEETKEEVKEEEAEEVVEEKEETKEA